MMSGIKGRRRGNDDGELSEHLQDAEIVVRQESDATLEKVIQSETKDDNEEAFNHEFSEKDAVDWLHCARREETSTK